MKLALKVNLLVKALGRDRAIELVPEVRHRDEGQRIALDVVKCSDDEIDRVQKEALTMNKGLARRIVAWRELRATPDDFEIWKASEMETALISYIIKLPHRIVFHRSTDGQMLPYFVRSISWTPLRKERDQGRVYIYPAYTTMNLEAYKGESTTSMSLRWTDPHPIAGGGDFTGACVSKMLEAEEVFAEVENSYARYEKELFRFFEIYRETGKQFSASGRCYGPDTDEWGYRRRRHGRYTDSAAVISLTREGQPSRVVIDPDGDKEPDEENDESVDKGTIQDSFWPNQEESAKAAELLLVQKPNTKKKKDEAAAVAEEKDLVGSEDDDVDDSDDEEEEKESKERGVVLPVHPYLQVFDFAGDQYATCHVNCLDPYKFNVELDKKLILPESTKKLIGTLIGTAKQVREDIVAGKTGGVIVMSTGGPGTGKTLTAEVFAERMEIPIYSVQCSQLGTTSEELEKKLILVLKRAMRWNALLLLDEADVYVRTRGDDMEQNAIVGVFLRLLEKFKGILFMTSNRPDAIDDAILSRCIAHIRYKLPNAEQSDLIWQVLADNYEIDLMPKETAKLVAEFPFISGRNIKTLLKLATSIASKGEYKKGQFGDLIREMSQFVDFPREHYEEVKARTAKEKK